MKKIILLTSLLAISYTGISQEQLTVNIAGMTIDAVEYQGGPEGLSQYYEKWLQVEEGRYMMFFKQTPVGYKHSLDLVNNILEINDLSFENDRYNESILFPPYCDGIYDYYCLPRRLRSGDAEVVIVWKTKDGDGIFIGCNDVGFAVGIGRLEEPVEMKESNTSKKQLDELMGGLNNADSKPGGDPYANTYYGSPGTGSGTGEYGLSGRSLVNRGKVQQECNEEGRVVVRIVVDRKGKVIDAQVGVRGTTNNNPCLLEPARKTAFLHKWNPDSKAPSQQIGFVAVNFKTGN